MYIDHAVIKDFQGQNLSGSLARWYLTMQAYNPEIKYMPGKSNVGRRSVVECSGRDSRRRDAHVLFLLKPLWSAPHVEKVISALESGTESQ